MPSTGCERQARGVLSVLVVRVAVVSSLLEDIRDFLTSEKQPPAEQGKPGSHEGRESGSDWKMRAIPRWSTYESRGYPDP
jgi:hypothetical protein